MAKSIGMLTSTLRTAELSTVGRKLGADFGSDHRGSRHERGYGTAWAALRLTILKRDDWLCQCAECHEQGRVRPAHEVDHIVNKAQGGTDDPANLQAINRDCHRRKTQREAQEFRR